MLSSITIYFLFTFSLENKIYFNINAFQDVFFCFVWREAGLRIKSIIMLTHLHLRPIVLAKLMVKNDFMFVIPEFCYYKISGIPKLYKTNTIFQMYNYVLTA